MSKLLKGIAKGVRSIGRGLKKVFKKITSSTIGKVLLFAAAVYVGGLAILFVAVSLIQFYVLRPVRVRGLKSGIASAYCLQYSRSGLKQGYFETLASAMWKAGGTSRDQVPLVRREKFQR